MSKPGNVNIPDPVRLAFQVFNADHKRVTDLFYPTMVSLDQKSDHRMHDAYVLANELIVHNQITSTLIEELRRFRGEGDGAYVPATRKAVDTGTLKKLPGKKSPPKSKRRGLPYREAMGRLHDDVQRPVQSQPKAKIKRKPIKPLPGMEYWRDNKGPRP